jgi:Lon protease-like protein
MTDFEISLFPIPGSVSLPFSTTSLHVFEPRYRKMIKDSIDAGRRIGVAHTQRVIAHSKTPPGSPLEDVLSSNQDTYLAHPIFSAGFAEIKETLPDGRLMVEIAMDARYKITQEIQQIPYKVVLCQPYEDEAEADNSTSEDLLRFELDQTLLLLSEESSEELHHFLKSDAWKALSFSEYSFKIYSFVKCDPDILQKVLELQSPVARVRFLKNTLIRGSVH